MDMTKEEFDAGLVEVRKRWEEVAGEPLPESLAEYWWWAEQLHDVGDRYEEAATDLERAALMPTVYALTDRSREVMAPALGVAVDELLKAVEALGTGRYAPDAIKALDFVTDTRQGLVNFAHSLLHLAALTQREEWLKRVTERTSQAVAAGMNEVLARIGDAENDPVSVEAWTEAMAAGAWGVIKAARRPETSDVDWEKTVDVLAIDGVVMHADATEVVYWYATAEAYDDTLMRLRGLEVSDDGAEIGGVVVVDREEQGAQ